MKVNILYTIMSSFLMSLLLLSSHSVNAAPAINAKVTYVGTYGNGRLFVGLNTNINEAGCVKARFDVPGSHTQISHWLDIARTARETGRTVTVRTNGCFGGYPTMNHTTSSYFYMR